MKFPDWLPVYGDIDYRGKCPQESAEQVTFFNWIRRIYPDTYGRIALHPRNEGKRTKHQALDQISEGLCGGAADIIVCGNPSFVCELKRLDHTKSKWQDGQQEFIKACFDNGSFVCVALGHDAAIEAFENYLKKVLTK